MGWTQVLYAKVARRVHQDAKYRSLSRNARLAWLTLLTSEHHKTLPGFWRASEAMILDELADFSAKEWRATQAELVKAGMLRVDDAERTLWAVNAAQPQYNSPDNPKIAKAWARQLSQFDRRGMARDYAACLLLASELWGRTQKEAFREGMASCGWNLADLETVSKQFREGIETVSKPYQTSSSATATAAAPANVVPESDRSAPVSSGLPAKRAAHGQSLPFKRDDALLEIARVSRGRFVFTKPTAEQMIALVPLVRDHPDLRLWKLTGEYLAAGNDKGLDVLGVGQMIHFFRELCAKAQAWESRGRKPIDVRPAPKSFQEQNQAKIDAEQEAIRSTVLRTVTDEQIAENERAKAEAAALWAKERAS